MIEEEPLEVEYIGESTFMSGQEETGRFTPIEGYEYLVIRKEEYDFLVSHLPC